MCRVGIIPGQVQTLCLLYFWSIACQNLDSLRCLGRLAVPPDDVIPLRFVGGGVFLAVRLQWAIRLFARSEADRWLSESAGLSPTMRDIKLVSQISGSGTLCN